MGELYHYGTPQKPDGSGSGRYRKDWTGESTKYSDYHSKDVRRRMGSEHPFANGKADTERVNKILGPPVEKLSEMRRFGVFGKPNWNTLNHPNDGHCTKGERMFNCPNCSMACEMAKRGYDVVARPAAYGSNVGDMERFFNGGKFRSVAPSKLPIKTEAAMKEVRKFDPDDDSSDWEKAFDKYQDCILEDNTKTLNNTFKEMKKDGPSRGIVIAGWWQMNGNMFVKTKAYHAFNYTVNKDGFVSFQDVQGTNPSEQSGGENGDFSYMRDLIKDLSCNMDPRELYFMRTDNLDVNDTVGEAVYSRGKR